MINDHLSLSDAGLNLLKQIERLSLVPYDDRTGKRITEWCKGATIGYGHLILVSEWSDLKNGINKELASDILENDLQPAIGAVQRSIIVPITQQQFDALVIFAFNIGVTGLRASSAVRMINDPRAVTPYPTLEKAWKAWNKSQGIENEGLKNRRTCEWDIYYKGIYQAW